MCKLENGIKIWFSILLGLNITWVWLLPEFNTNSAQSCVVLYATDDMSVKDEKLGA